MNLEEGVINLSLDDDLTRLINSTSVETYSHQFENVSPWKLKLKQYIVRYCTLSDSKFILAVSNDFKLLGLYDRVNNVGHLTDHYDLSGIFDFQCTFIPERLLTINNKLAFPEIHTKVDELKDLAREILLKLSTSPDFRNQPPDHLAVRSLKLSQSFIENCGDVSKLYSMLG